MAPRPSLKLVFGTGNVGDRSLDAIVRFDSPEEVNAVLDLFYSRGYRSIDTARSYSPHAPGSSEPRLGAAGAGERFTIDSKVMSQTPGSHSKENIERSINASLEALQVPQIDIEYLHQPDRHTPFEETCEAMNKAFQEGKFKRFGLSNYSVEEVARIIEICEKNGFVKPSVYQGQYNAIVRSGEKDLFPLLRKHSIAFYAWSPGAAGFFAGNHKNLQPGGRYDPLHRLGHLYSVMYQKESIQAATDEAVEVAAKYGIGGHAAALRWTIHHSILDAAYGDAIIVGASSPEQLAANLDVLEGDPLPEEVAEAMNGLFAATVGNEVPYHF